MTDTTNEFEAEYALHPDAHLRDEEEADTMGATSPPRRHHGGPSVRRTFRRTERRSLIRQSVRGAVSSLTASTVMGGLLFAAQKLGLLGEDPPTKLTRKTLEHLDLKPRNEDLTLATVGLHMGYGAMVGAVSGPLLERIPNRSLRVLGGVATGAAVWVVSYAGWIPALGWMRSPQDDVPSSRPWVMLGAHLVFGGVLGASLPAAEHVHELDLDDDPHVEAIGLE
ncbi:MAG: hypothetical protein DI536_00840 [Archangium gephyra]|uniref:DUF1440 domain-containing protein n=1 Tax=Archangium gephyra TaxID=48 RepID=A0A2W5TS77_9BACT|nr:MAG: hypothetical protein DI536_00840 [Archangium gephyra]